jgi:hypothetical protein
LIAVWVFVLKRNTGNPLGNEQFAEYNVRYLMHPFRFSVALVRRIYYLFLADFRWIGAAAILYGLRRTQIFRSRAWALAAALVAAHVLAFSLFGGAMLERYLLPVLPIVLIAMVSGLATLPGAWKVAGQLALFAGLVASNFWLPPYPFPLENNMAFIDYVKLHQAAAEFVEFSYPERRIATTWPLQAALARPEMGYVQRKLDTVLVEDFQPATLAKVDWSKVGVLVLYPHNSQLRLNLMEFDLPMHLWRKFYAYRPDVRLPELPPGVKADHAGHWERHGQWIDVYAVGQPIITAAAFQAAQKVYRRPN